MITDFLTNYWPKYLGQLEKRLVKGKFLCGNTLTIWDFKIAGLWTNMIENPNQTKIQGLMGHEPEKIKEYIRAFRDEMADYLNTRPESLRGF